MKGFLKWWGVCCVLKRILCINGLKTVMTEQCLAWFCYIKNQANCDIQGSGCQIDDGYYMLLSHNVGSFASLVMQKKDIPSRLRKHETKTDAIQIAMLFLIINDYTQVRR